MTEFDLPSLTTIAGVGMWVKYVMVPVLKRIWPKISGPVTVSVAILSGVATSLAYRLATSWPLSAAGYFEAVAYGIIGGAVAMGIQDSTTAAVRPEKL